MLRGKDVVVEILLESTSPARPHAGLRREVEGDFAVPHDFFKLTASEVDGNKLEGAPIADMAEVAKLLLASIVVVETVDAYDLVAIFEQRLGQV
jgi:hypothetical protein